MSKSGIKNVLIAGASGTLGPPVLTEFLASGKFNVFALVRLESKFTFNDKVKILKSDYTASSLAALFKAHPIDAVINMISWKSSETEKAQMTLIDTSKAAGVKSFIPADFGNDLSIPEVLDLCPIFAGKARAIEYLEKVQDGGFSWSTIINGPFFAMCIHSGLLGVNIKAKRCSMFGDGSTRFSTTNLETTGKALVSLLGDPTKLAATASRRVYIASHTITQKELFVALEKVSGEKWVAEWKNLEAAERDARERYSKGDRKAGFDMLEISTIKGGHGDYSSKLDNEFLGLPEDDLEADIKQVLAEET
ncbi:hypothetical protein CPB83DRAFT_908665 [Crepidotus variabilis]|uniref:NmrA-like domain-containing protein n=1 Tax=Crepidotus variabilis TaxID=179855 RepID=A0A9P6JMX8_9AGAR|nr:hypothetical protein CPB83DRAFT_908665 [Crepidotus variabilis]